MQHGQPPGTILVVDDEHFARLVAVQVLLDEGFTVLEASDAAEALTVLDCNDDIRIIITDISMPGQLNGIDLLQRVRATHPEIGFLLTSGLVDPRGDPRTEGAWFLSKPYTVHALMEAIRQSAPTASDRPERPNHAEPSPGAAKQEPCHPTAAA